jgi:hypothetical protein
MTDIASQNSSNVSRTEQILMGGGALAGTLVPGILALFSPAANFATVSTALIESLALGPTLGCGAGAAACGVVYGFRRLLAIRL